MFTYSAVLATVEDPDLKPHVNDGHKTATDSSSGWEIKVCVCVCVCVCSINYAHAYIWLYSLF